MDEGHLARAADAAASNLSARGAVAQADGTTVRSLFGDGPRVVVRNSLKPSPAFSREHLLQQVATQMVRAWLDARPHPPAPGE